MLLIYESGRIRIMMQEDQLHIEVGNEPRIFIIIEGIIFNYLIVVQRRLVKVTLRNGQKVSL